MSRSDETPGRMAPGDVGQVAEHIIGGMSPEQRRSLMESILAGNAAAAMDDLFRVLAPTVRAAPVEVCGFRVRLDLMGAKPPVWRRLELQGDITLDRLHAVIQAAMGWTDSHLHRFRTGGDHRSPSFVTRYDVEAGEEGVLEDGVRFDQVVVATGDRLWYEYDFGDGWDHSLAVEAVVESPPAGARCTAGRGACPPEDCGGMWGYAELAKWVRNGSDPSAVPELFDNAQHAREWLPLDWHPDRFDVDEADSSVAAAAAGPPPLAPGLAEIVRELERRGSRSLSEALAVAAGASSASGGGADASDAEAAGGEEDAARLTNSFAVLLDVIGDGVNLTSAGYLPPVVVERIAERTGATGWWIGKANREDLTWPVAHLRTAARAVGLVNVRKGVLTATAAARRVRDQPLALLQHITSRLPLGKTEFDRCAGWLSLAVVAGGAPMEEWDSNIRELLTDLGWRVSGGSVGGSLGAPFYGLFPVDNPTLDVLEILGGRMRRSRLRGVDPALAATCRAVIGL